MGVFDFRARTAVLPHLKKMTPFPLKARPIWISSFPRSGNTFFRILCSEILKVPTWSIYHLEESEYEDYSSSAAGSGRLPGDWRSRLSGEDDLPPALLKTHGFPDDDAPAIYLLRNGILSTESWYHYHKNSESESEIPLEEVIAGATQFGSWASHVKKWDPFNRPNTLVIPFEELVGDPQSWLGRIADFCGLQMPESADGAIPGFKELQERNPTFFRAGQSTNLPDWSQDQFDAFANLQGETMQACGYDCPAPTSVWTPAAVSIARAAERRTMESLANLQQIGRLAKQAANATDMATPSDVLSLSRLIKSGLDVETIYDIGASNAGWSNDIFRALLPDVNYHLFEPQADIYPAYRSGLDSFLESCPKSKLYPVALGDVTGEITLHADPLHVGATTLDIQCYTGWEAHTVPIMTLESIIDDGAPVPTVIKIDTQGSELKILQGMGRYLEEVSVLFLETWLVKTYDGKTPLLTELAEWLAGRGFYPWEFGRSYRDETGLLVAPDVIFMNVRCPQSPNHAMMDELI